MAHSISAMGSYLWHGPQVIAFIGIGPQGWPYTNALKGGQSCEIYFRIMDLLIEDVPAPGQERIMVLDQYLEKMNTTTM